MKRTDLIVRFCLTIFVIMGLGVLYYKNIIDDLVFYGFAIVCVIALIIRTAAFSKDVKQAQKQADMTSADYKKVGSKGNVVSVPPTIAGLCCDFFTLVMLVISWGFIFKKDLLDADNSASAVIVIFTLTAIFGCVNRYSPIRFGSLGQPLGIQQVKQQAALRHATALSSALAGLALTLKQFLPDNAMVEALSFISLIALLGLCFWGFFIKRAKRSSNDIK